MKKIFTAVVILLALLCLISCSEKETIDCPECDCENSKGDRYCADCGAKLSSSKNDKQEDDENESQDKSSSDVDLSEDSDDEFLKDSTSDENSDLGTDGADATADAMQKLPAKLRIGIVTDYEPFCYTDDSGELIGFDKEYIFEIAKALGYKTEEIEFIKVDIFDKLFVGLGSNYYDLIISGIVENDARNEEYLVSDSYVTYTGTIVDDSGIEEPFSEDYVIYGKGNEYLIEQVNLAIQALENNGTANGLIEKWLKN